MNRRPSPDLSTHIRKLSWKHTSLILQNLDFDEGWRSLVGLIQNRDGSDRYGPLQVQQFERALQRPGGSPSKELLNDWGTQLPTVEDLLSLLREAGLTETYNVVWRDVLNYGGGGNPGNHGQVTDQPKLGQGYPPPQPRLGQLTGAGHHPPPQHQFVHQDSDTLSGYNSVHYMGDSSLSTMSDPFPSVSTTPSIPRTTRGPPAGGRGAAVPTRGGVRPPVSMAMPPTTFTGPHPTQPSNAPPAVGAGAAANGPNEMLPSPRESDSGLQAELQKLNLEGTIAYSDLAAKCNGFSPKGLLGSGGFGEVFKGSLDGKDIAVKRFKKLDASFIRQFIREMSTLTGCKHENILEIQGISVDGPVCLIFEYMKWGSLDHCLTGQTALGHLKGAQRLHVIQGACSGLAYLHTRTPKVIHRDVKSANILLGEQLCAKMGDFGLAKSTNTADTCTNTMVAAGSMGYMPPESLEGVVSDRGDSYAMGVVLMEILTGWKAYDPERDPKALKSYVKEMYDSDADDEETFAAIWDSPADWTSAQAHALHALGWKALNNNHRRRPSMQQMMSSIASIERSHTD